MTKMKIYRVGGCVRDQILGLPEKDVDYVVIGSSEKEMLSLGYERVGVDFPVFLNPETNEEYALARREKKVGAGYNGFEMDTRDVSLEEDLFRRDLTINAMAMDIDGNIIDPFNGHADIKNKVLRHVSDHFKEDPVRILRVARFSARYNFAVAPETLELMRDMVTSGEFSSLTGERVWKEFGKVVSEQYVGNFFKVLESIGALEKLPGFPKRIGKYMLGKKVSPYEKLLFIFSYVKEDWLNEWKIPIDLKTDIEIFKSLKNDLSFYSGLTTDRKIVVIKQFKFIHGNEKRQLFDAILTHLNLKFSSKISHSIEHLYLNRDIQSLKKLDYKSIVDNYKGNTLKSHIYMKEIAAVYEGQMSSLV